MAQRLLDQVAEVVAGKIEDLTPLVRQVLEESSRQVAARVQRATYDADRADRAISQSQRPIREVQAAFRRQRGMNPRWLKGLDRGRLDDRRLWKVPVSHTGYFKRRDATGIPHLALGLLLDVSGSMRKSMDIVWQTAAVFSQGLTQIPGINFAFLGYTGEGGKVALTRICDRQFPRLCLAGVEQGRETPSGAAIAAMKVLMERMPEKRRLLIHFTDGRADNAAHLSKAMEACQRAGIGVYTIGLAEHSRMLSRQFGERNYEAIQKLAELPQAVARIVQRLDLPQSSVSNWRRVAVGLSA